MSQRAWTYPKDGFLIFSTYNKEQEEDAKWLSGCLLLTREALLLIRRLGLTPQTAAAKYGVSVPMLTFRQNVLKLAQISRERCRSKGTLSTEPKMSKIQHSAMGLCRTRARRCSFKRFGESLTRDFN
jgi:hypothetical protein